MSFLKSIFGGGQPSRPKPVAAPVAPTRDDPEVQREAEEARRKQRLAGRLRAGRRSTILTSGQGVLGEGNQGQRKQLLGA